MLRTKEERGSKQSECSDPVIAERAGARAASPHSEALSPQRAFCVLSDAQDTVNWDQQLSSSLEREEEDRKEREWENYVCDRKMFHCWERSPERQRAAVELARPTDVCFHRIRIRCTKVQTTQVFKTDLRQGSLPFPVLSTESQTGS